MNLKAPLTNWFKKAYTPDEEERVRVPSPESRQRRDSEKQVVGSRPVTDADDDSDQEEDRDDDDNAPPIDIQPAEASSRRPRRILSRVLSSVFPSPSNEEEIQAYVPHYRTLPILSGIAIPFAILLEIPGITSDWHAQTEGSNVVHSKPNSLLLDVGIALSLFCAVLANLCLVIRFLERRIKMMTILCVVFLSIHDMINIAALVAFGATNDGYSLEHPFWLTLCSTIVSMFTNVTLIVDLICTPDFKQSGSGLTRRQRSLVIIIIGLFCYLALGALINSLLLDLSFVNGLYFTVVTIETIGFGDIVPNSRNSRVFICFYATVGVINLAFVVGYVRETVLEGLDFGYRKRVVAIKEKRRAAVVRRRAENRWRHAVVWRLRERRAPVWIPNNTNEQKSFLSKLQSCVWHAHWGIRSVTKRSTHQSRGRHGMKLNLRALPHCQLEAAALEAGVPLDSLLPEDFYDTYDQETCKHSAGVEHHALPSWFVVHPVYHRDATPTESLTHRRLGGMAVMLSKLSFAVYESGGGPLPDGHGDQNDFSGQDSSGSLSVSDDSSDYREVVADTEKRAYVTRSGLSWGWFLIFWMGGAAIFTATEGWSYGSSIYFCFISFTTIGYGDLAPVTLIGRAIFIVWALIGVATMTTFISVVSEAYASRYKGILGRDSFKHVVEKYRTRTEVELSEEMQNIGTRVRFFLDDSTEREETDVVEDESQPTNGAVDDTSALASSSQLDPHSQAQQSLERLPRQILTETRSIQQYMQLMGDFDKHSADMERFVDQVVWDLVDEVMGGRKLTGSTKMDLLHDSESRQMLMVLGIERSLKELMGVSEQAIRAIQQRDRIIESLQREREEDEAEVERSSGTATDVRE